MLLRHHKIIFTDLSDCSAVRRLSSSFRQLWKMHWSIISSLQLERTWPRQSSAFSYSNFNGDLRNSIILVTIIGLAINYSIAVSSSDSMMLSMICRNSTMCLFLIYSSAINTSTTKMSLVISSVVSTPAGSMRAVPGILESLRRLTMHQMMFPRNVDFTCALL
jgi:hypothetical protein